MGASRHRMGMAAEAAQQIHQSTQVLIYRNGTVTERDTYASLRDVLNDPENLVWVHITGPVSAHDAALQRVFRLSPISMDMLSEERERGRLVEGERCFHLVLHGLTFNPANDEGTTPKVDLVFGHNFLLTHSLDSLPWLDQLWRAARVNPADSPILGKRASYLLYAVFDALVDSYFPVLDDMDDWLDDLEDLTVRDTSNEVQARIFRVKRVVAQMRRVISPQVEIANGLVTRTGDLIPEEYRQYYIEVHDHALRAFEILDSYRDLMSSLVDVHLSTVSNRMNAVMKQLTIIATIFLPITFVTGVFGQNFKYPPQVIYDPGWFFWGALALMLLISLAQIYWFKRRGWM